MPSLDVELTQHAAFLAALARRLTASGNDADDLVQDVYVAALQHGPAPVDEPRPWLAKVLRRSASRATRSTANRTAREQDAARPTRSTERSADELELGQRLLGHVRALESPYRDVLYQRYYEGLMPREIAERAGCSVATVKTRLARALARMRERLDADDARGREAWFGIAVLAGRGRATPKAVAGVGAVSGLMFLPLLIAFFLASAGLLVWFLTGGERGAVQDAQPALVRTAGSSEQGVSMAQVDAVGASQGARVPGAIPDALSTVRAQESSVPANSEGVGGVVLDLQGDPIPGATVKVRWRDASLGEEETVAGEDGRFYFADHSAARWFEASLSGWHFLNMTVPGYPPWDDTPGAVILMTGLGTLHVEAVHPDGSPVGDLPVWVIADSDGLMWPGFAHFYDTGVKGVVQGGKTTLRVPAGVPLLVGAASVRFDAQVDGVAATSAPGTSRDAIVVAPRAEAHLRIVVLTDVEVHGTVVDPSGDPLASVALSFQLVRDPGVGWGTTIPEQTTTDERGAFVVRVPSVHAAEMLHVTGTVPRDQTGGTDLSLFVDHMISLQGMKPRDVMVTAIPESLGRITGSLIDANGAPVEGTVELEPGDGVPALRVETDSDGQFRFQRLSASEYRVRAWSEVHLEADFGLTAPGGDALALRLEEHKLATLEVTVTVEDPPGMLWGEVRFIRVPSELAVGITGERLSSGSFRPVESGKGRGWADLSGFAGAVVEARPIRSYKDRASTEIALEPGLYWIGILGDVIVTGRRSGHPLPLTRVESGLVRVGAGKHAIDVTLQTAVIWTGRVIPAEGGEPIERPFMAVCDAVGRPMMLGNTHFESRFHAIGWRGSAYVTGVPRGEHEVWIGTRAELEAGAPRVRRRVLFAGERCDAVVTY